MLRVPMGHRVADIDTDSSASSALRVAVAADSESRVTREYSLPSTEYHRHIHKKFDESVQWLLPLRPDASEYYCNTTLMIAKAHK